MSPASVRVSACRRQKPRWVSSLAGQEGDLRCPPSVNRGQTTLSHAPLRVFRSLKPADGIDHGAPLAARVTVSLVEFRADCLARAHRPTARESTIAQHSVPPTLDHDSETEEGEEPYGDGDQPAKNGKNRPPPSRPLPPPSKQREPGTQDKHPDKYGVKCDA